MKRIIFIFAVCFAAMTLFAVDGQFFTAKKGSPAEGAVLVRKNATLALAFKLAPEAPENFNLVNIYMFTDSDRNTGRKGIGNEYYFDIAKGQMSSYAADGQGTLHRNALTVLRAGQWYIITFDESITAKAGSSSLAVRDIGSRPRNPSKPTAATIQRMIFQ